MDPVHIATAYAATRHGVIHRCEALAHGMTERQIDYRVRQGIWKRLHAGVYLIPPARLTFEARCRAALVAVGEPAVLTGSTAAHLLGLLQSPPEGSISLVHHQRIRKKGLRVHVDPHVSSYPKATVYPARDLYAAASQPLSAMPRPTALSKTCSFRI